MKLKFIAAGILAAASFSASAATYDLGILDPTGSDTLSAITTKFAANSVVDDFWTFKLVTPSSTSFGALQTFSVVEGAIKDFSATLLGYGNLTYTAATGIQSLSWDGQLAAGSYTVHVTGLTGLKNAAYLGSVSALPVPEPETYGMLLGGLALVGFAARRRAQKVA